MVKNIWRRVLWIRGVRGQGSTWDWRRGLEGGEYFGLEEGVRGRGVLIGLGSTGGKKAGEYYKRSTEVTFYIDFSVMQWNQC